MMFDKVKAIQFFGGVLVMISVMYAENHEPAGFLFLEEPINARLVAMGAVGTAVPGGGYSYYNPAKPFLANEPYLGLEFGMQPGGLKKGLIETPWTYNDWFVGLTVLSHTIDFTTASEQGVRQSIIGNYQGVAGALTAGIRRNRLGMAVQVAGVQDKITENHYHGISFSGGLTYTVIPDKFLIGAAGFHLGYTKFTDGKWEKGRLPRNGRTGAAWIDTIKAIPFTAAVDIVYRDQDRGYKSDALRIMVPVGIDVKVHEAFSLRAGKRFGHETEVLSWGAGVHYGPLAVDVGFVNSKLESNWEIKPLFGITYYPRRGMKGGGTKPAIRPTSVIEITEEAEVKGTVPDSMETEEKKSDVTNTIDTLDADSTETDIEEEETSLDSTVNADTAIGSVDTTTIIPDSVGTDSDTTIGGTEKNIPEPDNTIDESSDGKPHENESDSDTDDVSGDVEPDKKADDEQRGIDTEQPGGSEEETGESEENGENREGIPVKNE